MGEKSTSRLHPPTPLFPELGPVGSTLLWDAFSSDNSKSYFSPPDAAKYL